MKKMFAIVRNDIDRQYQAVQLGHVTSVLAAHNNEIDWTNQTFVWLKASMLKMLKLMSKLEKEGVAFETFNEPDIGNELTAIACLTEDYHIFKNLKLYN